jgi:hypothetical protein
VPNISAQSFFIVEQNVYPSRALEQSKRSEQAVQMVLPVQDAVALRRPRIALLDVIGAARDVAHGIAIAQIPHNVSPMEISL